MPIPLPVLIAGLVTLSVTACAGGAATPAPASAPSAVLPRSGTIIATIPIPPGYGGFAVGEGSVWAMSDADATLTRIDPANNVAVARVTVEPGGAQDPSGVGEAAAGNGAVWISHPSTNTVSRVDPQTNSVTATIPVGPQPAGISSSPGAIWVANAGGPSVSRIDPASNRLAATISVGPTSACCSGHMAIAASGGGVWVSVPALDAVVRIDPGTNSVTATVPLLGQPCGFLAADDRATWAAGAHCAAIVTRVDPSTNRPNGKVDGEAAPIGLALGFGSLWVADLDSKAIDRVDPITGRVIGRLVVGGYPIRLAVGFGSVWVRDDTGRVLRIRPSVQAGTEARFLAGARALTRMPPQTVSARSEKGSADK